MSKEFIVNENYIVWGFRYALGRKTGAVDDVVTTLKRVWGDLEPFTQEQIQSEIEDAIKLGRAGWDCDIESWQEILSLEIKNEK